MAWRTPFKRAWKDTLVSLGVSDFSLIRVLRTILVSGVFVGLMWVARGSPEAMTEASDIGLYLLAFIVAAFLPAFVWNLWLAPYNLLKEEIDKVAKTSGPTLRGTLSAAFNVADWEGIRVFQLGDAACLWVGVEPHSPLSDPRALAMFKRLSGDVLSGRLRCNARRGLANLFGGNPWWPKHEQELSAVALRRYADDLGRVPPFLGSVVVPIEENPAEEENKGSRPD